jgi:DNA (cytosine-5)-methyltransferase 1
VNVGSLFAGIGGFDLGLQRAGMRVAWQVEIDRWCRAVLARHFPEAERFEDVREVGAEDLRPVDLLCGGFPCQDLSAAGRGAGIDGARSGLWGEFARIVRELRPRYVLVENVPALLTGKGKRWDRAPVGRVLGDLAEAGYDAEWACLSAREFGAPHLRKRVWLVAYPARDAEARPAAEPGAERQRARPGGASSRARELSDADRDRCAQGIRVGARGALADPERRGRQGGPDQPRRDDPERPAAIRREGAAHPARGGEARGLDGRLPASEGWGAEPDVGRVADGVPARVDRLAALGNALLPQIAEWIGRRILAYEREAEAEAGEAMS